jgi:hypothetical protein
VSCAVFQDEAFGGPFFVIPFSQIKFSNLKEARTELYSANVSTILEKGKQGIIYSFLKRMKCVLKAQDESSLVSRTCRGFDNDKFRYIAYLQAANAKYFHLSIVLNYSSKTCSPGQIL